MNERVQFHSWLPRSRRPPDIVAVWVILALSFAAPISAQQASPVETGWTAIGNVRVQSTDTLALRPPAQVESSGIAEAFAPDRVPLDLFIANRIRSPAIQESAAVRTIASVFRSTALPGTLILAAALYGAGELSDRPDLSDLGLHTGQAVVAAGAVTLAGKIVVGRSRPNETPDDPYDFQWGGGWRGNAYQSFPSAHTAVAFAAAAVLIDGIEGDNRNRGAWIAPLLYGSAGMAGVSRLYHEEHWASDVIAGALIGTGIGSWMVHQHRHNP